MPCIDSQLSAQYSLVTPRRINSVLTNSSSFSSFPPPSTLIQSDPSHIYLATYSSIGADIRICTYGAGVSLSHEISKLALLTALVVALDLRSEPSITNNGTMVLNIPLEIWEEIIDHNDSDKPSLLSCGLVCASWVAITRCHLFKRISLYPHQYTKFIEIMIPSSTCPARFVRDLSLYEGHGTDTGTYDGDAPYLDSCLPLLSEYLSAVTALLLKGVQWNLLSLTSRTAILRGFPHVKSLTLFNMSLPSLGLYKELVSSFHNLHSISSESIHLSMDHSSAAENPLHAIEPPPKLQAVRLVYGGHDELMSWLGLSATTCHIRRLTLPAPNHYNALRVATLLNRLERSLTHLHVDCGVIAQPGLSLNSCIGSS